MGKFGKVAKRKRKTKVYLFVKCFIHLAKMFEEK